jgi:hypothetical protein
MLPNFAPSFKKLNIALRNELLLLAVSTFIFTEVRTGWKVTGLGNFGSAFAHKSVKKAEVSSRRQAFSS